MPVPIEPQPFAQAIAFARRRQVVLPEVYYGTLVGVARSNAFSIAGIASADQLQRVLDSLADAMQAGSSFNDWKKRVRGGEIGLDLPDHRLDNIFRTNLQTHYSRGRSEQQRHNAGRRPFGMYDAIDDSRTRPHHAALDGFVAPLDDPRWDQINPPNGFRCRCRRIAVTERQARRFLEADADKLARDPELSRARQEALRGDNFPDKGWDYDPGEDVEQGITRAVRRAKEKAPAPIATAIERKEAQKPVRLTLDEMVERGEALTQEITNEANRLPEVDFASRFRRALTARLAHEGRKTGKAAKLSSRGKGATLVKKASKQFPDTWTQAADEFGELRAKFSRQRASHISFTEEMGRVRTRSFGIVEGAKGLGLLSVYDLESAIHEYAHRLQHAMPELDDYFQELHVRRTGEDPLRPLREVAHPNYGADEMTREDDYIDPYMGREYTKTAGYTGRAGALELLTMAFELTLTPTHIREFDRLYSDDRELFNLAIGLLFNYDP